MLTRADKWIVVLATAAGLMLWFVFLLTRSGGNEVLIEVRGRLYARSTLDATALYSVPGPIGITRVEVKDGAARIISSPCPEKRLRAQWADPSQRQPDRLRPQPGGGPHHRSGSAAF